MGEAGSVAHIGLARSFAFPSETDAGEPTFENRAPAQEYKQWSDCCILLPSATMLIATDAEGGHIALDFSEDGSGLKQANDAESEDSKLHTPNETTQR